jgi:hypothetical protein
VTLAAGVTRSEDGARRLAKGTAGVVSENKVQLRVALAMLEDDLSQLAMHVIMLLAVREHLATGATRTDEGASSLRGWPGSVPV